MIGGKKVAEDNISKNDSNQPRRDFMGFGDLLTHIGGNLKKSFIGENHADYQWPNWDDNKLGKPPTIVMPSVKEQGDIAEFDKVLSNISKMASVESAAELRNQLKTLSGVPINIKDLAGNADKDVAPIGTPVTNTQGGQPGTEPWTSFNPRVWGKYPVEGDKGNHGIASPEQMFIHDVLGHYAELYKSHQNYLITDKKNNNPMVAFDAAKPEYQAAMNEPHIVNDHENAAMSSVDPNFKRRDAARYSEGEILHAGKNGYPEVLEQDRNALIQAIKISGRPIPAELQVPRPESKASEPLKDTSMRDNGQDQNQTLNAVISKEVLEKKFAEFAKEGASITQLADLKRHTDAIIATNEENGTLPLVKLKSNIVEHKSEQGREFS